MSIQGDESGRVVLIVEDEPLVRDIAVDEFRDAGYQVLTAGDDRTALDVIESEQGIDLLFTDIRIPGELDGWGVASFARRVRPGLPVIYSTGFSAEQVQMVEGSRFFRKPYRMAAVLSAASEMMNRGSPLSR